MNYALLAATSALSSFAVVVIVLSAAAALLARPAVRRLDHFAPGSRAAASFRLRMLPAAVAAWCGFGLALPIFVRFEPLDTDEPLSRTLIALAVAGAWLLVRSACRAATGWRATARTSREWRARSRPVVMGPDSPMPVYAIDATAPVVAVLGICRPVLFISERVLAESPAEEIRAMIAHEIAHVVARDNLKRLVLIACPDAVGERGVLTRAWATASEEAADARAAATHPGCALDLAHALIRVVRLAPQAAPELASAFCQEGGIERRVRRLLEPAPEPALPIAVGVRLAWAVGLAAVIAALAGAPSLHQLMETIVRVVP